jgi:AMP-binding enzyme
MSALLDLLAGLARLCQSHGQLAKTDLRRASHSVGAPVYFPERTALVLGGTRVTFRDLHGRVKAIAATLSRLGLGARDRLAVLLPNGPEYIELLYACSWLGVIVVPINTRLSAVEIDRVLADARLGAAFIPAGTDSSDSVAASPGPRILRSWGRFPFQRFLRPGSDFGSYLHQRHHWPAEGRHSNSRKCLCERAQLQLLDAIQGRRSLSPLGADIPHR